MKLELKHLAPYLPFRLKAIYNSDQSERDILFLDTTREYYNHIFKPILRPLSEFGDSDDLRKVHEFIGLCKWCESYEYYFSVWFDDLANIDKLILQAPQEIFNYFLANHFDVFGLIKEGLAVDINSLVELNGSFNSH